MLNSSIKNSNLAENIINADFMVLGPDTDEKQEGGEIEDILLVKQKYKNQILLILYWIGKILHAALPDRLGLSASGLTATLKKLNDVDNKPLEEKRNGKFKFYSLTEEE